MKEEPLKQEMDNMGSKTPKKMYREPLAQNWAFALLTAPSKNGESYWGNLITAKNKLGEAVALANEGLRMNPLLSTVAAAAARQLGRRGEAAIVVDPDGSVMLEVRYSKEAPPSLDENRRPWRTDLPALEAMREEAKTLGLDISGLGRSKRKIAQALAEARSAKIGQGIDAQMEPAPATPAPATPAPTTPPPARKKMIKTAPAISVVPGNGKDLKFPEAAELPDDLLGDERTPPENRSNIKDGEGLDIDTIIGVDAAKKP